MHRTDTGTRPPSDPSKRIVYSTSSTRGARPAYQEAHEAATQLRAPEALSEAKLCLCRLLFNSAEPIFSLTLLCPARRAPSAEESEPQDGDSRVGASYTLLYATRRKKGENSVDAAGPQTCPSI